MTLPSKLWIILSTWGGASPEVKDVFEDEETAQKEFDRLRREELSGSFSEDEYDLDNDLDLDAAWEVREYDGADQQEYELLYWEEKEETEPYTPCGALTWNELADLYHERTGEWPKTKPLDQVYEWATKLSDIVVQEDGTLVLIKKEQQ